MGPGQARPSLDLARTRQSEEGLQPRWAAVGLASAGTGLIVGCVALNVAARDGAVLYGEVMSENELGAYERQAVAPAGAASVAHFGSGLATAAATIINFAIDRSPQLRSLPCTSR